MGHGCRNDNSLGCATDWTQQSPRLLLLLLLLLRRRWKGELLSVLRSRTLTRVLHMLLLLLLLLLVEGDVLVLSFVRRVTGSQSCGRGSRLLLLLCLCAQVLDGTRASGLLLLQLLLGRQASGTGRFRRLLRRIGIAWLGEELSRHGPLIHHGPLLLLLLLLGVKLLLLLFRLKGMNAVLRLVHPHVGFAVVVQGRHRARIGVTQLRRHLLQRTTLAHGLLLLLRVVDVGQTGTTVGIHPMRRGWTIPIDQSLLKRLLLLLLLRLWQRWSTLLLLLDGVHFVERQSGARNGGSR